MIGVFDYTVILTYLSLASSIVGVFLGFDGNALGASICIMLCGLLDGFDGKVARTKKNRTQLEKLFGVQIDSLCDIMAFGLLPVSIGYGLGLSNYYYLPIYVFFVLAGVIRLAYFNSLDGLKIGKGYIGLPITCSTFIFPLMYLLRNISFISYLYPIVLLITALLFVFKIKIKKPSNKNFMLLIAFGLLEFILLIISSI